MRLSRKPLLVLSMVGMAFALPAMAQPSAGYPAACEAAKVTKKDSERAHTVFLSGKGFLDEANYDKAISYFKDAYTIDCSVHGILPIIATAYERKGDKGEAVGALEEYLRRVPDAGDREVIERRIKNLKDQIGQAAASATATSTALVTSSTVTPSGSGAPTGTSGTATAPTGTGTGGVAPSGDTNTTTPWIVVGAGGVLLVAGGLMFVLGTGDVSAAEKTCPNHGVCGSTSAADQGNRGRLLEGVGIVSGIAGIVGVGGGIVWHLVQKPDRDRGAQLHVTPAVAPGYAGVGLGGSF